MKKKKVGITTHEEGEDRISMLPDELIHHILSFLDIRVAVGTSILSKRWELVWTTLPFLDFDGNRMCNGKFIDHVLSLRNHEAQVSRLKLNYCGVYELSTFSFDTLEKLKLDTNLVYDEMEVDCGNLPALKSLDIICPVWSPTINRKYKLPEACLSCLSALRTLCLERCELPESSLSFMLPDLTTLRLITCKLPQAVWNFRALLSLELDKITFPRHMKTFICELVSLQNRTLGFRKKLIQDCSFSCPQLLNLKISTIMSTRITRTRKILVIADKVQNFESIGIFPVTFEVNELVNVHVKLWVIHEFKTLAPLEMWNLYYQRFVPMFSELCRAQTLSLDLATNEALSAVSNYFAHVPSPFSKLNCVKLPQGYEESSMSSTLRKYLLGGSSKATIFTALPQHDVIPQVAPVSKTVQSVVLEEPSLNLIKEAIDSEEEHVLDNDVEEADGVRQVDVPVAGAGNDPAWSSRGHSHYGLWQGHEVNSEFVGLLDLIMEKYPETFERFTSKSKVYTMKLNMFCSSMKAFIKTSLTDVTCEMIFEYRELVADFQRWGLNVDWLSSRLDYIEQIQFSNQELRRIDSLINDAKNKLQELQTLRVKKMTDIKAAFGDTSARLTASVGEGLFSGPQISSRQL